MPNICFLYFIFIFTCSVKELLDLRLKNDTYYIFSKQKDTHISVLLLLVAVNNFNLVVNFMLISLKKHDSSCLNRITNCSCIVLVYIDVSSYF